MRNIVTYVYTFHVYTLYVCMYMHVCGNMVCVHVDTLPTLHPEYERAKGVARYTIDPTLNELLGSYYIIIPAAVLCKNDHPSTIQLHSCSMNFTRLAQKTDQPVYRSVTLIYNRAVLYSRSLIFGNARDRYYIIHLPLTTPLHLSKPQFAGSRYCSMTFEKCLDDLIT